MESSLSKTVSLCSEMVGTSWSFLNAQEPSCCGLNSVEDLGQKQTMNDVDYVCVNEQFVKGIPELTEDWGELSTGVAGERWAWVKADGTPKYQILTMQKPGQDVYDIFSDLIHWLECTPKQDTFPNPKDITNINVEKERVGRMACYHEGTRWSWAIRKIIAGSTKQKSSNLFSS